MNINNIDDDKDIINNNMIDDKCSRCGESCGLFIPFTKKELEKIKKYVKEHNIQPVNRLTATTFDARCCFYDKDNKKCLIYEVRPWVCKDFKCNRKNWKSKRDQYEKYGDFNGCTEKNTILATFDEMVYGDLKPMMIYINSLLENNEADEFVNFLYHMKRLDILKYIQVEDIDHNIHSGQELWENYKKQRKI